MKSAPAIFDDVAASYDDGPNPMLALEERFLRGLLPNLHQADVVDVGCGTGRWLKWMQRRSPKSLTGIDPSSGMLEVARLQVGENVTLRHGRGDAIPIDTCSADLILLSFSLSYCERLDDVVSEIARIARSGAHVFVTDVHPATESRLNWRRSFRSSWGSIEMPTTRHGLRAVSAAFAERGLHSRCVLEVGFEEDEKPIFMEAGMDRAFTATSGLPAIYIMQFRARSKRESNSLALSRARVALTSRSSVHTDIGIGGTNINELSAAAVAPVNIDLTGCLVLPGLVNAHDHLEFGLFPNLGRGPYKNCREWAEDIHVRHRDDVVLHSRVPKDVRLYWGALRNLLAGVTTVCHHNPMADVFRDPHFPVRVIDEIGWAHSLSFDPQTQKKFQSSLPERPFVVHAAEGVDQTTKGEVAELDALGALDGRTVLVHGLNVSNADVALINARGAAVVLCPSSNHFLFSRCVEPAVVWSLERTALGTDSPLTAAGDMLDEIRFAKRTLGLSDDDLFEMCTTRPASILRLSGGEGTIRSGARADLLVIRDQGGSPASELTRLDYTRIEMVIVGGEVRLVSDSALSRLPQAHLRGLLPLQINSSLFWVRAPLPKLFAEAHAVLGETLQLGKKQVTDAR